jgi:UTP--glucose-1-phosphate uridylyltransferase
MDYLSSDQVPERWPSCVLHKNASSPSLRYSKGCTRLHIPVRKAVIPAAGLGTRLLSATKESPKEMLPIFASEDGMAVLKPVLQVIFEQLNDFGILQFCFVVGRGKRAIEDHFTPDKAYLEELRAKNRQHSLRSLASFYSRVDRSAIFWVNQPEPLGFGQAVLQSRSYSGGDPIFVHAGDTVIISNGHDHLQRLFEAHRIHHAQATLLLQSVADPRKYGVAEVANSGKEVIDVNRVVEKPEKPTTNLAIMPVYIFEPIVFDALEATKPDKAGETQLTDAIQRLIIEGRKVQAIELKSDELSLDIGTIETYWEALRISHDRATSSSERFKKL